MKKFYLKTLLVSLGFLLSMSAFAQDFVRDGLAYEYYYNDAGEIEGCKVVGLEDWEMEEVVIPATVEDDGGDEWPVLVVWEGAFSGCENLRTVTLGENVKVLEKGAFEWCSNLAEITLNEGLVEIGEYAFQECGLTTVTLPSSVKYLKNEAFRNCAYLQEVNLNEGLEVIQWGVFASSLITTITLPSTLQGLEEESFGDCSELTEVIATMEDPFAIDVYSVFSGVDPSNITLTVPDASAMKYLRNGWRDFGSIKGATSGEEIEYVVHGVDRSSDCITITVNGEEIYGEYYASPTQNLEIEFSVEGGFPSTLSVDDVDVTADVVDGQYTLEADGQEHYIYVNAQTTITVDGVVYDLGAIYEGNPCASVVGYDGEHTALVIPATVGTNNLPVKMIVANAFKGNGNLESVTLPASIVSLGSYAFSNCRNLSEIKALMAEPSLIYSWAWGTDISQITLAVPTASIDNYMNNWVGFGSYVSAETGEEFVRHWIGRDDRYDVITSVTVNGKECDEYFYLLPSQDAVIVYETTGALPVKMTVDGEEVVPTADENTYTYTISAGEEFDEIYLEDQTTFTQDGLAYNLVYNGDYCAVVGLEDDRTELVIPATVTYADNTYDVEMIGADAFNGNTDITSVTLPASIIGIDYNAFYGCENLTSITSLATTPFYTSDWNGLDRSNITLAVPEDAADQYIQEDDWRGFKDLLNAETSQSLLVDVVFNDNYFWVDLPDDYYLETRDNSIVTQKILKTQEGTINVNNWDGKTYSILIDGEVDAHAENISDFEFEYTLPDLSEVETIKVVMEEAIYRFWFDDGLIGISVDDEEVWDGDEVTKSSTADVVISFNTENLPANYGYSLKVNGVDVTDDIENDTYTVHGSREIDLYDVTVQMRRTGLEFADKYMTFSSDVAYEFAEDDAVKAWIVSGYKDNQVMLTRVNVVPAYTGVLLEAEAGTNYQLKKTDQKAYYSNALKAVVETTWVDKTYNEGNIRFYNLVLGKVNDVIGFYRFEGGEIEGGKAYLPIPQDMVENANRANMFTLVFEEDGEATEIADVKQSAEKKGVYYNLNGQLVKNPTTGIYIKDGKKVYVK